MGHIPERLVCILNETGKLVSIFKKDFRRDIHTLRPVEESKESSEEVDEEPSEELCESSDDSPALVCKECGKEYKFETGLSKHKC